VPLRKLWVGLYVLAFLIWRFFRQIKKSFSAPKPDEGRASGQNNFLRK